MADDRRRRQPLPPLPPLAHHPVNPPFNPAANQEPLPAFPPSVVSSSSRTRPLQVVPPKRERIAPRQQPQPRPSLEESPEREQPDRYYWVGLAHAGVTGVLVGFCIYCVVRYSRAIRGHADDAQRRRYAIAFTFFSSLALAIFSVNLTRVLRLPARLHLVQQSVIFLGSISLLIPTLFNLAFVSLWRHRSPAGSTMSPVGQCRWDIDVVWGGRSGQCPDAPAKWGGWLAGAIVRFIITLLFLIACHGLTWLIDSYRRSRSSAGSRQRSQSAASLMNSHKSRRGRHASKPAPPTTSSSSSSHGHRRTFSSSNTVHASSPSSLTYIPNHLTRTAKSSSSTSKSPSSVSRSPPKGYDATPRPSGSSNSHDPPVGRLSPTSDISDYYSDVDDGGDLNRFAANFKTLVERVSRETEDGSRLTSPAPIYNLTRPSMSRNNSGPPTAYAPPSAHPPRRSPSPRNSSSRRSSLQENNGAGPSSPPAQSSRSNDVEAHAQMQHDLLQAHRLMLLEQAMRAESYEHIVVLGGAVRRMSTIASVADGSERSYREPPWTPTSGTSSYMTPMELTRSPSSSTARSGRRNPMSRHAITPPPGSVGLLTDSFQSERGHYTD